MQDEEDDNEDARQNNEEESSSDEGRLLRPRKRHHGRNGGGEAMDAGEGDVGSGPDDDEDAIAYIYGASQDIDQDAPPSDEDEEVDYLADPAENNGQDGNEGTVCNKALDEFKQYVAHAYQNFTDLNPTKQNCSSWSVGTHICQKPSLMSSLQRSTGPWLSGQVAKQ